MQDAPAFLQGLPRLTQMLINIVGVNRPHRGTLKGIRKAVQIGLYINNRRTPSIHVDDLRAKGQMPAAEIEAGDHAPLPLDTDACVESRSRTSIAS
jgi:hypothetical protein